MSLSRYLLTAAGALLATNLSAASAMQPTDWPHLRGPDFNSGTVADAELKPWTQATKKWEAEAGISCGGVVVVDGKALTLGHQEGSDVLTCYQALDGTVLWTHKYEEPLGNVFYKGGPNTTPTVLDGKVYWISRQGNAFCLELASGKQVWNRQIQFEEALNPPRWGISSAALPFGETLILNIGDGGMAIEQATGKTVWKNGHGGAGYAAPTLIETAQGPRVLLFAARELVQVDPATGKIDWRTPWQTEWDVNAASPVLTEHGILISSGYKTGTGLIALDGSKQLWFSDAIKHQMAGPVKVGAHLYGVNAHKGEPGLLYCMDPKDGAVKWSAPGFGTGSVIAIGDKLLALSDKGKLVLAEAKPDGFKELASAQLMTNGKKDFCWNTPALAGGLVYAKNDNGHLVCFDISK